MQAISIYFVPLRLLNGFEGDTKPLAPVCGNSAMLITKKRCLPEEWSPTLPASVSFSDIETGLFMRPFPKTYKPTRNFKSEKGRFENLNLIAK